MRVVARWVVSLTFVTYVTDVTVVTDVTDVTYVTYVTDITAIHTMSGPKGGPNDVGNGAVKVGVTSSRCLKGV